MKKINFGLLSLILALIALAIYPLFAYFEDFIEPILEFMQLLRLNPFTLTLIAFLSALISLFTEDWSRKKFAIVGLVLAILNGIFTYMLAMAVSRMW